MLGGVQSGFTWVFDGLQTIFTFPASCYVIALVNLQAEGTSGGSWGGNLAFDGTVTLTESISVCGGVAVTGYQLVTAATSFYNPSTTIEFYLQGTNITWSNTFGGTLNLIVVQI